MAEYDIATERRGMGLIQGLQLSVNPKDVIANALDNGLIYSQPEQMSFVLYHRLLLQRQMWTR